MMDQILMQFCDQKHNAWPYIVKQDHTGQDKDHKNSSGDEIANVNFLRRYGTYVLQNTKKKEPTSFNQLDDS